MRASRGGRWRRCATIWRLLDSGLDSLSIAVLVARLEDRLGTDPFTSGEDVHFPVTVGDFVKAYENGAR